MTGCFQQRARREPPADAAADLDLPPCTPLRSGPVLSCRHQQLPAGVPGGWWPPATGDVHLMPARQACAGAGLLWPVHQGIDPCLIAYAALPPLTAAATLCNVPALAGNQYCSYGCEAGLRKPVLCVGAGEACVDTYQVCEGLPRAGQAGRAGCAGCAAFLPASAHGPRCWWLVAGRAHGLHEVHAPGAGGLPQHELCKLRQLYHQQRQAAAGVPGWPAARRRTGQHVPRHTAPLSRHCHSILKIAD